MVHLGPLQTEDFKDVRDFFTAVGSHQCDKRKIVSRDHKGTNVFDTYVGFECEGCGTWFRLTLAAVKCLQIPMRGYVRSTDGRIETARRLDTEPEAVLLEMRNSGGWAQPDPGVAFMTTMAAASGPPGNPMEQKLKDMMKGGGKPS